MSKIKWGSNTIETTCTYCKNANEYIAWWWYPYYRPTCLKGHSLKRDKSKCKDFECYKKIYKGE